MLRNSWRWCAGAVAALVLGGCGNPNQLTGDVCFPIEGAHLLRIDAGTDVPPIAAVYLTEPDVDCDTLRAFDGSVADGQPLPRPFKQAVVLEWFDVGNSSYAIGNTQTTFAVVNSVAEWLVGGRGGSLAVSGAVDVTANSPAHIDGRFDTTALEAGDYSQFFAGGFIDDAGNPRWPDGGRVSALKLSGNFGADACP